jgi:hypothetical protein
MTFVDSVNLYSERGQAEAHAHAAASAVRIVNKLWAHSSPRLAARHRACHARFREAYLPIRSYPALAEAEVIRRIESLSPSQLWRVKAYERTHLNRKALLNQVDRRLGAARG